jgi:hypothetical protein
MCGVGGKADRRPIDPPPIVQLRVIDPLARTNGRARGRQLSPGGRRSMESDDDEEEVVDEEKLVFLPSSLLEPFLLVLKQKTGLPFASRTSFSRQG